MNYIELTRQAGILPGNNQYKPAGERLYRIVKPDTQNTGSLSGPDSMCSAAVLRGSRRLLPPGTAHQQ